MIKAALISILVTGVVAILAWGVHVIQEREQLLQETEIQQDANESLIKAMSLMEASQLLAEKQIIERDRVNRKQKIKLISMKRTLENELKKITPAQEECLYSDMPDPIIKFLFQPPTGNPGS